MPDAKLGAVEKHEPEDAEDAEGGAGGNHPPPPPSQFFATLTTLGKIGGIIAGVVAPLWFVYAQFSGVTEKIHLNQIQFNEIVNKVDKRVEKIEWVIIDRQGELGKAAAGLQTITLQASRDDLTYICGKLRGTYDFRKQYCDAEGRKVLYRFVPEEWASEE